MNPPPSSPIVAILGAGPAACTLAALLGQRGLRPVVFDDGRRPEMLVGESLIPAVLPLLRRLDLEERVAAISQRKPGVSFTHGESTAIHFNFAPVAPWLPTYAYNVDRLPFDDLLKARAQELGAAFVPHRAGVRRAPADSGRDLLLDEATLAAVPEWQGRQPDLIVDATGRSRLVSRVLDLPAERGERDDVSCFAHFTGCARPEPDGQVVISRLEHGWSWRIPLPGRVSIGIVVSREAARGLGSTPAERLENAMQREPQLREGTAGAVRVSPVATYANYQLTARQSHGPGWVLAGDAFGFVDPMLSSGLFLAMESAAQIDAALFPHGECLRQADWPAALTKYDASMRSWYAAWTDLIRYFYDGRIFSLYEAGHRMRQAHPNAMQRWIDRMANKHIACMASGALTRARFSQWFLRTAARWLVWGVPPPRDLAIRI